MLGEKSNGKFRVTASKKMLQALQGYFQWADKCCHFFSPYRSKTKPETHHFLPRVILTRLEAALVENFINFVFPDFPIFNTVHPQSVSIYIRPHKLPWENQPTLHVYSEQTVPEVLPIFCIFHLKIS